MSKASEKYGYDSIFPTRFRDLMDNNKVNQKTMAEFCGVQRQSISQWYNGETRPDILSLGKIAEYFNVSTDYLLGLKDNKTTDKATQELCYTLGLSEDVIDMLTANINLSIYKKEKEVLEKDLEFISENEEEAKETIEEIIDFSSKSGKEHSAFVVNWLINEHMQTYSKAIKEECSHNSSILELLYQYMQALDGSNVCEIVDWSKSIDRDLSYSFSTDMTTITAIKTNEDSYLVRKFVQELLADSIINQITTHLHNIQYEKFWEKHHKQGE